ncbi:MAG: hypothetical protein ACKOBW_12340 [Planctomycetota bacterium]
MTHPLDRRDGEAGQGEGWNAPGLPWNQNKSATDYAILAGWMVAGTGFLVAVVGALILATENPALDTMGSAIHTASKLILVLGMLILLISYRFRQMFTVSQRQVKRQQARQSRQVIVTAELIAPAAQPPSSPFAPAPRRPAVSSTQDLLRQMSALSPMSDQPSHPQSPRSSADRT